MFKGFNKSAKPAETEKKVVALEAANAVTSNALRSLNEADDKLADRLELPRATRSEDLRKVVQEYAALLEQHCLRVPYQWYNFFDFWQEPHSE